MNATNRMNIIYTNHTNSVTKSHMLFEKHDANNRGIDYVAGDLHGQYDLLDEGLRSVGFNPAVDRLFLVGDLVDRGPASRQCLDLLTQPWVFAVRGNHEDIFLSLFASGRPDPLEWEFHVKANGLGWTLSLSAQERQDICRLFAQLPLARQVKTKRGIVGVVHAEIPLGMSWQQFQAEIERSDGRTVKTALWGRTRARQSLADRVEGVDRLFCGHTIHDQVTRRANVYWIDTGAFLQPMSVGHLTLATLVCQSDVLLKPSTDPVNIRATPTDQPFSSC